MLLWRLRRARACACARRSSFCRAPHRMDAAIYRLGRMLRSGFSRIVTIDTKTRTKKNAAKAAFSFALNCRLGRPQRAKPHLDYCRSEAVVVRGAWIMFHLYAIARDATRRMTAWTPYPTRPAKCVGRLDWTRTNDPHHVKVVL
ncbi:hypothetical protein RSK60_1100004 [Ralstonia solanacearum K60]|nr:hypothetical protein RSK60_1100004 [Ralstonia solanacearum K60]